MTLLMAPRQAESCRRWHFRLRLLAQDDDSGVGTDAQITYLATTSGTFYLAATAFNNQSFGTYAVTMVARCDDQWHQPA